MSTSKTTWERLNAYVDGELGPRESAAVAREVALDAMLAAQVAAITALKAAAVESLEPMEPLMLEQPATHKRRAMTWVAGAACAILLGGFLAVRTVSEVAPPELRVARDMHARWIRQRAAGAEAQPARVLETSLAHMGLAAYAPDLSSVDLFFAHIRPIPAQSGRGLHIGYLGRRGCMMSLVVVETATAGAPGLHELDDDAGKGFTWYVDRYRYVMLAARMDPRRFAKVAAVVESLTRRRAAPSGNERLALQRSREQARPCAA